MLHFSLAYKFLKFYKSDSYFKKRGFESFTNYSNPIQCHFTLFPKSYIMVLNPKTPNLIHSNPKTPNLIHSPKFPKVEQVLLANISLSKEE